YERLRLRQADCARKVQFLFSQVAFRSNHALPLCLKLHLGPEHIDSRHHSALAEVHCPVINRLRRSKLSVRSIHAAAGGNGFQVQIGCDEDDEFPYVLLSISAGCYFLCSRTQFMEKLQIDEGVSVTCPCVEDTERSDDLRHARKAAEPECREIGLLNGLR